MRDIKKYLSLGLIASMSASSALTSIPVLATEQNNNSITSNQQSNVDVTADVSSSWTVTIPKSVNLSNQNGGSGAYEGNIPVEVEGDIGVKEIITVDTLDSMDLTDTTGANTNTAETTITKGKVKFTFNDLTGGQVANAEHNISAELTPGEWSGILPFNINLQNELISVTSKDSQGNNLNATATEITGAEKESLLNSLVSTGMIGSTSDVDALIEVESDDFTGMADTTFDVGGVFQEGDKVVILHFDETKQEWEYISTETVDANGLINANFSSYSPVVFIKVENNNSYNLLTLTENNYTMAGINKNDTILEIPETFEYEGNKYKVVGIGEYTFSSGSMTSVKIPNSVTRIDTLAFGNCPNLSDITIPKSVNIIGDGAFKSCKSLTNIKVDQENETYYSNNGIVFTRDNKTLVAFPAGNSLSSYTVPSGTTRIQSMAFDGAANLKSVSIPEGITTIEDSVFYGTGLTSITLPDSVTSIGYQAFGSCDNLTSVTMSNNVREIGGWGFAFCENLTNIKMSTNIEVIGASAFRTCSSLPSISLGNKLNSIGASAFYKCSSLTTINYAGTQAQWANVEKGDMWDWSCSATVKFN